MNTPRDKAEAAYYWRMGVSEAAAILENKWRDAGRPERHLLSCDEYHAHFAPECCDEKCWCRQ